MSLRRRTYPEVLANLLASVTGGVAAESHPFPPPTASAAPFRHDLQQPPAAEILSVYGSRDGLTHLFRKDADYRLLPDRQKLEWLEGGALPDPGTLIEVNYYPGAARPVLTDFQTGSVVRTLAESVGLEIARLYAQLEAVYDSAFVDTATGSSLDSVVALLGIERVEGGKPAGEVELRRAPGTRGSITIPAGTRIITADGSIEYATTASVTLAEAQTTIRIVARDVEDNEPLPADALTVLPAPIAGIASVTNPAPTAIGTRAETDTELRERAKNFLHGSERATLGALQHAIARQGLSADIVEPEGRPGELQITPHAALSPDQEQRFWSAIEEARPAGVRIIRQAGVEPHKVNLELQLTTLPGLVEQDLRAAQRAVREKIEDYFARLPAKEPGSVNRIVGLVLSVPQVQDVRMVSATRTAGATTEDVLDRERGELLIADAPTVLGELAIADPSLPTTLSVVVTYPADAAPPDRSLIQPALTAALAYLNTLNSTPLLADASAAERAKRELSFGKLLLVIPLPGKPGVPLERFDNPAGAPPALPSETTIAPYRARFVVTLESGLSQILEAGADEPYVLTPFERLSLGSVEVAEEPSDG